MIDCSSCNYKCSVYNFENKTLLFCFHNNQVLSNHSEIPVEILANICRLNSLSMIYAAGSGHIGTSFSAADIMTLVKKISVESYEGLESYYQNIFFSSKGHDAPMLYSVMHAFHLLKDNDLLTLRRINGLPGHPTIGTQGVVTNTGSLGMGISKAKGIILGNRIQGISKKVIVLLGDGELQEGQIWESLPGAIRDELHELVVIVDANGIQSDTWTENTLNLGSIRARVQSTGWNYIDCDGHSVSSLSEALASANSSKRPTWIQAKTTKGKGVSFMEEFPSTGNFYKFHSGAPSRLEYETACQELLALINPNCKHAFIEGKSETFKLEIEHLNPKLRQNSIVDLYGEVLRDLVAKNHKTIVLDADLTYDTGTYKVKRDFPSQYIQCGIAEQDMTSISGGLALTGLTPIVHSFGTFLTMRSYEQIFNNSTENTRVIYVGFLAGILPGMPGVSHQAVNDAIIMDCIPNMRLFEPSSKFEMESALGAAMSYIGPSYIRMQSIGSPPSNHQKVFEVGTCWNVGTDHILVCSGVSMLTQAKQAVDILEKNFVNCSLVTIFDFEFEKDLELINFIFKHKNIYVLENHLPGRTLHYQIEEISRAQKTGSIQIKRIGPDEFPACGQNNEVLQAHGLHPDDIVENIKLNIDESK